MAVVAVTVEAHLVENDAQNSAARVLDEAAGFADDVAAGIYANIVLQIITRLILAAD